MINIDYIGVVTEDSTTKKLQYRQIPIEKEYNELIHELEDMVKNENRTVLDLQSHFKLKFHENPSIGYSFCWPYSYSTTWVGLGGSYPKIFSFDEYQKSIEECKENYKKTHKSDLEKNPAHYEEWLTWTIKRHAYNLKKSFLESVQRYINGRNFYKTLRELAKDSSNKMFSTDAIGWTNYHYQINDDVHFDVKTNFGFGMSSYFYVNLRYKDIEILPYSDVVKYYYANMIEFVKYTRSYYIDRDSWNVALNFVVEVTNQTLSDEKGFVEKWIINEVEEMMSGLERIAQPTYNLSPFITETQDCKNLLSVRNADNQAKELYKIYPNESTIAFQAEKVSGALQLLESLRKLTDIYPKITLHINRIIELNIKLLPNFEDAIPRIEKEVESRQNELNKLKEEQEALELKCKPHLDAIQTIFQERHKENSNTSYSNVEEEYRETHKEYEEDSKQLSALKQKTFNMEYDIRCRNIFIGKISGCIMQINKYISTDEK